MSIISEAFEVLTVKRTELIGKTKTLVSVFFATEDRDPADTSGVTAEEVAEPAEWWQAYGFVSNPPEGVEALVMHVGQTVAAFASRYVAGGSIFGKLNKGDVAVYSIGKAMLRVNADGSIALMRIAKSGQPIMLQLTADDKVQVLGPNGSALQMATDGVTLNAGNAPLTLSSNVGVQIVAPALLNKVGLNSLHVAGAKPMIAGQNTAPNVLI